MRVVVRQGFYCIGMFEHADYFLCFGLPPYTLHCMIEIVAYDSYGFLKMLEFSVCTIKLLLMLDSVPQALKVVSDYNNC